MQRAKVSRTRSAAQTGGGGSFGASAGDTGASAKFSRPTSSPTAEKNDIAIKTMLSDRVNDDLRRFAREQGYGSVSDCVREMVMTVLYGRDHLLSLHERRISALAKNLAEIVPGGGA